MLCMLCVTAFATTETITISDLELDNATLLDTCDIGGNNFTLTFSKASGSNSPAYYESGSAARIYASNTVTVSSDYNITGIVITWQSSKYAPTATSVSFSEGSYDADTYTWTGETTSVTMTNDSSAQIRFTAIEVTYDDSESDADSGYDWHWTFDSWTTGSFSATETTVDGLTYIWSSGRSGQIGEAEATYGDNTYTKYCQFGSKAGLNSDGTPKYSALSFGVTGPCEIYVVAGPYTSSASSRDIYIALAGDTLATASVSGSEGITSFTATYDLTADTTIYVYAANKVNVYEIDVTYTDDNNDGDGNTGDNASSGDDDEEEETETLTATYTLTPASVTGAWLSDDDAVSNTQEENIDTVRLVFDEKVYINSSATISGTSDLQSSTVTVSQPDSVTIEIIVSGTDGTGWQYVIIEQAALGDSTANANNFTVGNMNARTLLYYYWEEPSTDPEATIEIVAVTPEQEDTVETLSSLVYEVEMEDNLDFFINTLDEGGTTWTQYIAVSDSSGTSIGVSGVSIDEDTGSQFTVTLDNAVSSQNIVYVNFKAGFLGNTTWYSNNYSKGEVNKDTTFVYYVIPAGPTYDLEYVSVDPQGAVTDDELDELEALESLETVTLTYDVKVAVINDTAVIAYNDFSDTVSSTAVISDDEMSVIISFDSAITTDGTWYVKVPKGTIGDSLFVASEAGDGAANDSIVLSYVIYSALDEGTVTIDPADGDTVDVLSTFTITYEDLTYAYPLTGQSATPYLLNADGDTVTTATAKDKYSNYCTITLAEEVSDIGTYTLVLPDSTFYLEDQSSAKAAWSTAREYTYIIPMPELTYDLAIDSISPNSDSYVEELSTITLYFGEPVYINPNGSDDDTWSTKIALYDYSTREEVAEATLSQTCEGDSTVIVTLDSIFTEYNTFRLYLPQGVIGDATAYKYDFTAGSLNARMSSAVVITVGAYDEGTVTIDPADGSTVSALTAFTVTYEDQGAVTQTFSYYPYLSDSNGDTIFIWTLSEDDASISENVVTLTLTDGITTDGTYTLTIPAATFSLMSSDGGTSGYNSELIATYIVDSSTGISNVSGTDGDSYRGISADADGNFNVYTVSGMRMMTTRSGSDINNLPAGLYIINGKKAAVK